MKILWRKRGFTTNSSGSYEWLPGQNLASSTTSVSSTTLPKTNELANLAISPRLDGLILLAAILAGASAVYLLIKELIPNKKPHAHHQKGRK
ncbi:MAG: hypothetical protein WCG01_05580 [bacterium]